MPDSKFDLYTYQLSPVRNTQYNLFQSSTPQDELILKKNSIFYEVCTTDLPIFHRSKRLKYKIEYLEEHFILLRIANKKIVAIEKEFHRNEFESEPSCLVAIYNDPEIQVMAVESDKTSFGNSKTVIKLLQKALSKELQKASLRISIQAQYEESAFWQLVRKYDSKIDKLQFTFEHPNLPRVNKFLSDEIKKLSTGISSSRTTILFDAGIGGILDVDESNEELNLLVKASSSGAGPIKIRPKGSKRFETTAYNNRSIFFDQLDIDSSSHIKEDYAIRIKQFIKSAIEL